MKILTYTQWSDYLKQIATDLTALSHTAGEPHYYEFDSAYAGTQLNAPALIGIPPSGRISDAKSDDPHLDFTGEFLVVTPCKMEDFAGQLAAYDTCLDIGWDIITKLVKDNRDFAAGKAIYFLDPNTITHSPVGPVFSDNHFGIHFIIPFANPRPLNYNAAKWN